MGENWRDEHPVVGIFWHNFPEKWNPVYTHTLRMMKGLAGREGRLVFLTNKEDMSEPSDELVEGVHVKRSEYLIRRRSASSLNKPLLYLKWVLLFQLEEIRLAKMVYVRDLLFSTLLLCRLLGKPLVLEKNDVDEADPNLKRNLMGRLTYGLRLRVLDFVDAVVVQTEESKRAHERIGIPSKRIIVVPNGVDTDLFSFEERSASDKVKLLYIAHLDENKSLDITLSVAREMGDDVELSIVGDGPRRAEFEGAARRLGLDNVTFLGTVSHSEMPRIISAHDFGIGEYNLKYREFRKYGFFFFPLKILEYLSCGRPVFVNVSNGVIHELERSGTVLRVARKDDMVEFINDFQSNPRKMVEVQRKAREVALDFDWKWAVGALVNRLSSLEIL